VNRCKGEDIGVIRGGGGEWKGWGKEHEEVVGKVDKSDRGRGV